MNYLMIVPKKQSTAKTQLLAPTINARIKDLDAVWMGGKKLPNRTFEFPDRLFFAIQAHKKDALLQVFNEFRVNPDEVDLVEVQVAPKKVRKAASVASCVKSVRDLILTLENKKTNELKKTQELCEMSGITKEEEAERMKEIAFKYREEISSLEEKADKLETTEMDILMDQKDQESCFFIDKGKTHEAADKGIEILANPDHGVFRRSDRIVRIVKLKEISCNSERESQIIEYFQIINAEESFVTYTLGKLCAWEKFDERSSEGKARIDFPPLAAKMIVKGAGFGLMPLKGFINTPILRLDGSLSFAHGYDRHTGLFFDPLGTKFEQTPSLPTKKQAIEALSLLSDVLKDFPFENEISKSVMLAELMTSCVRSILPAAPLFANDASVSASGKTLLARLPSYLASGKAPCMLSPSKDEEEMRKRLGAALMEGCPVICLDNIDFKLESRDLCVISTNSFWNERILGESRNSNIETNCQIILTGNNLCLAGDLCTRVLKCRLIPQVERPESRSFDRDLNEYVVKNRGALVSAILTIIRAYFCEGCPDLKLESVREYRDWCRMIRQPLVWLGCEDPCKCISEIKSTDPEREEMESIFGVLMSFPSDSFTVNQVIKLASNTTRRTEEDSIDALYEVLFEACGSPGFGICSKKLGNKLRSYKDRIFQGKKIVAVGKDRTNKTIWKFL